LPAPAKAKLSALAVLSLVLGVLGCTGIGALAGLVCGLVALVRINRSGGRLTGRGLAIAGLLVSALMVPISAGLLLPALAKAKSQAQTTASVNHLKQLGLAARMYSTDHADSFPPAERWTETLRPFLGPGADQVLRRPANAGAVCGYGYNQAVAGKKESEVDPDTVLFFELEVPECDAVGGEELLRHPRSKGETVVVGYADGSVMQLRMERLSELRWEP
jgi:type II secretory pathway pseudopilin PulG